MYDVIIIGAGVSGAAVARELSRYKLRVAVLEKEEDVCCGTSKANSGIVHSGLDAKPGSMKARMNIRGNEMMEELAKKLDFPFERNGSLVLCFEESGREKLESLRVQGSENGVAGLRILEREELRAMEPNLSDAVICALYAPTGGIVCPFKLNIAMAENAYVNGVEFFFDTEVEKIEKMKEGYRIQTNGIFYETKTIINAAGVYADTFHNMVSEKKLHITARKGEYCLFDKKAGKTVHSTIFQMPTAMGKGILVTPTVHGNLLMGPTAIDIADKEGIDTTAEGLDEVLTKAKASIREIPTRQIITSFSGLRAHEDGDDFVIGETPDAPGFFDVAGIESPGLTSAPAIGEYVRELLCNWFEEKEQKVPEEKSNFIDRRNDTKNVQGPVICRCETVTEGEIIDAVRRPLGAKSLDGVKRRTRAGMGRCQSGFCATKVMEILSKELEIPQTEITKAGGKSRMLTGGVGE